MFYTSISTLKALEGYLASKADHGDDVAKGLRQTLMPLIRPNHLAAELRAEGSAVVIFSPHELGGVSPRVLENRLVELGNEVIFDLAGAATAATQG